MAVMSPGLIATPFGLVHSYLTYVFSLIVSITKKSVTPETVGFRTLLILMRTGVSSGMSKVNPVMATTVELASQNRVPLMV